MPTMRGFGLGTDLLGKVVHAPEGAHTFSIIRDQEHMVLAFSLWANPWFTAFVELGDASTWPAQWQGGAVVVVDLRHRKVIGPITPERYVLWLAKAGDPDLDLAGLVPPGLP